MASTPTPLPLPLAAARRGPTSSADRGGAHHDEVAIARGFEGLPGAEADGDGWGAEDLNKGMGKEEEMDG
jgi:hypothetical protein